MAMWPSKGQDAFVVFNVESPMSKKRPRWTKHLCRSGVSDQMQQGSRCQDIFKRVIFQATSLKFLSSVNTPLSIFEHSTCHSLF